MQFIGRLAEPEQVPVSRTISRFARYGLRSPSCRQKRTVASGNPRKRSALRFLQMPSNQRVSEFGLPFDSDLLLDADTTALCPPRITVSTLLQTCTIRKTLTKPETAHTADTQGPYFLSFLPAFSLLLPSVLPLSPSEKPSRKAWPTSRVASRDA